MSDQKTGIVCLSGIKGEIEQLLTSIPDSRRVEEPTGTSFTVGGDPAVRMAVGVAGPGLVSAARVTEEAIRRFTPDVVCSIGTAGGLSRSLRMFDLFVAREVLQHDVDLRALRVGWGKKSPLRPLYSADSRWIELLLGAVERLEEPPPVRVGRLLSGSAVVDGRVLRERPELTVELAGEAVDMETSAIAAVATAHRTPWISFRIVSDLPGVSDSDFRESLRAASRILSRIITEFVFNGGFS